MERKKGNIGFSGKGFEFNEEENNKLREFRKELSKAYGLGGDGEEEGEEDLEMVKNA